MLSFIRKRLPSKDRTNINSTDEQSEVFLLKELIEWILICSQDDPTKKATLANLKKKKKTKRKEIFSSVDNVSNPSPDLYPMNRPYSDVDYFPLMPGALSRPIQQQRISTHSGKIFFSSLLWYLFFGKIFHLIVIWIHLNVCKRQILFSMYKPIEWCKFQWLIVVENRKWPIIMILIIHEQEHWEKSRKRERKKSSFLFLWSIQFFVLIRSIQ